MPGKSRRQKEKRIFKPVAISERPASIIPPAVKVTLDQPAPGVRSAPAPATAAAKAAAAASSYVNRELLNITLMAGIMLVVVIIVSILLR